MPKQQKRNFPKKKQVSFGDKIKWQEGKDPFPACNIIMGLYEKKNCITSKNPLDMTRRRDMLIVDVDYFIKHHNYIFSIVKGMVEKRDRQEILVSRERYALYKILGAFNRAGKGDQGK